MLLSLSCPPSLFVVIDSSRDHSSINDCSDLWYHETRTQQVTIISFAILSYAVHTANPQKSYSEINTAC